jgi:hypothetical protein
MTFPVSTRTAQNLMDYIRRQFGDDASVQIQDADLITWINMGQMDIVTKLECLQATSVATSVANQNYLVMPTDVIKMESVYYSDKPLKATSMDSIQTTVGSTISTDTGDPIWWWIWANRIYMYPVPDNSTTSVEINYIKRPLDVANGASLLSIPDAYYNALAEYVMIKAQELDENLQGAQISKQKYDETVTSVMGLERQEQGAFLVIQEYVYD